MIMEEHLYWDHINVGDEITPLPKVATTQTLVKWAGASGDLNPLHYDSVFVKSLNYEGITGPVIHGALKRQWLIQAVTDWMGEESMLSRFSCRYRAMDYPRPMKTTGEPEEGETWWCKGKVTKKYVREDQQYVDCEVWVENGKGETTTSGKATVLFGASDRESIVDGQAGHR